MCGIGGAIALGTGPVPDLSESLHAFTRLLAHRGPDGEGRWASPDGRIGLAHRRLSIIDLSPAAAQPMRDERGNIIVYNGEIYNYRELRAELGGARFNTASDTEVILRAYQRWGTECVSHLRGMFAFALWDPERGELFCARDRFGIKPFYYAERDGVLYFASEAKALLPFLGGIATDLDGFRDYLAFQFCLAGKTLFKGVQELLPGHTLTASPATGRVAVRRYWEVYYDLDFGRPEGWFEERLRELLADSVRLHLRADVPLGAYVSGGVDSAVVASLAARGVETPFVGFTGRYPLGPEFDESEYARLLAARSEFPLYELEISAADFIEHIGDVIYHLDYPVAGPGSFSQYMVSGLAAQHRKVVLGGQGGDEVFGGYARYLIAYFEQCIKAAINGTMHSGNFVVTYESIIPNLVALRGYQPLLQEFWRDGLFEDMDRRYFRLINRAPLLGDAIVWDALGDYSPFRTFQQVFHGDNVRKESYFDLMTHFDFKTLLPALLQVEDRVSMAHGLESRVPLLDHPLVEFAATIPADVKFRHGNMKHVFRNALGGMLPPEILARTDKMGFPTPVNQWVRGEARSFVMDTLSTTAARNRDLVDNRKVLARLDTEPRFGRNIWGLLCLELWQQRFHDRAGEFRSAVRWTASGAAH